MTTGTTEYAAKFDTAFQTWLEGARKIRKEYLEKAFPNSPPDTLEVMEGNRYIRIVQVGQVQRSAWAFIDKTNGDVLKVAGWKAPAKHARGNIFDDKNGLGSLGPYGPASLR